MPVTVSELFIGDSWQNFKQICERSSGVVMTAEKKRNRPHLLSFRRSKAAPEITQALAPYGMTAATGQHAREGAAAFWQHPENKIPRHRETPALR